MRLTMVGTGYVGLVTGTCFSNTGNQVTCLDIDEAKIQGLKNGISPIYEPGLEPMITRNVKANRLHFTTDSHGAFVDADVIFVCVGTPSDDAGHADLKYVLAAASGIGKAIEAAPGKFGGKDDEAHAKIIVVKSTVPVGTNEKVRAAIAAETGKTFHMASNPEFLKEGAAINDFNKPDRVVLGVSSKEAGDRLRDLYDPFVRQGNPIFTMDIPSAEMVKYAANAMLATKISFINEIANLCESYGADVDEVRRGMCSDKRIGNQFLYPGLGYGGSCFPKDVLACIAMGDQVGHETALLKSVHEVNQAQRLTFFDKITAHFGNDLTGKKFGIWGIAFKPGTDDIREAPSVTLMQQILDLGGTCVAFDSVAAEPCKKVLGDKIEYVEESMEALDGVDALVICTEWDEFRQPDLEEMKSRMKDPVIFDGRNIYHLDHLEEAGFIYYSVGRKTVGAVPAQTR